MTDTIACPIASDIAGYCSTWGRTFFTLARFCTNAAVPGTFSFSLVRTDWSWPTEVRVGRSPVPNEKDLTCSGAVNHLTKSIAACFFLSPLLNTTQLSGPEIVWWVPPDPAKVGITCTPYWMSDSWLRSHGPVTRIATLPLFISLGPFSFVVSK